MFFYSLRMGNCTKWGGRQDNAWTWIVKVNKKTRDTQLICTCEINILIGMEKNLNLHFYHHSKPPHMETCPSNSKAHPGRNHLRYTASWRNSAEVRADKDAKTAAKAEKKAQKQEGCWEAAEIEEQTHQKMQGLKNHTGILTSSKLSIPRKQNEWPAPTAVTKGCL